MTIQDKEYKMLYTYKNSRDIILLSHPEEYTIKRASDNQNEWGHVPLKNRWY